MIIVKMIIVKKLTLCVQSWLLTWDVSFGPNQGFRKFGISLRSGFESPEKNFGNQKFCKNPRDTGFINLVI